MMVIRWQRWIFPPALVRNLNHNHNLWRSRYTTRLWGPSSGGTRCASSNTASCSSAWPTRSASGPRAALRWSVWHCCSLGSPRTWQPPRCPLTSWQQCKQRSPPEKPPHARLGCDQRPGLRDLPPKTTCDIAPPQKVWAAIAGQVCETFLRRRMPHCVGARLERK